ncbi:MAG TPA: class I SAM-dependent methyltransferase [Thermoanaerobaculia bacterium]|nr:class I SAM-dependent methyltransferase [Thermoanaerobaculia bacterium]
MDKWDIRYRSGDFGGMAPASLLTDHVPPLPPDGRALDLACGAGRNAIWLAGRGWRVTGVDASFAGLQIAQDLCRGRVALLQHDLERDPLPFADASFDLVLNILFLHRPLFAEARRVTRPGGTFMASIHTTRAQRMNRAWCLGEGELREVFHDWEIVVYREDVVAEIVARRPHFIHSKTT